MAVSLFFAPNINTVSLGQKKCKVIYMIHHRTRGKNDSKCRYTGEGFSQDPLFPVNRLLLLRFIDMVHER